MDQEQEYYVMDDTTNIYDFDDLDAFLQTLDPKARRELEEEAAKFSSIFKSAAA